MRDEAIAKTQREGRERKKRKEKLETVACWQNFCKPHTSTSICWLSNREGN